MKAAHKFSKTALHVAPITAPDQIERAESDHVEACSRVHALAYLMSYVAGNASIIEPEHFRVAAELIEEEIRRAAVAFGAVAELARGAP